MSNHKSRKKKNRRSRKRSRKARRNSDPAAQAVQVCMISEGPSRASSIRTAEESGAVSQPQGTVAAPTGVPPNPGRLTRAQFQSLPNPFEALPMRKKKKAASFHAGDSAPPTALSQEEVASADMAGGTSGATNEMPSRLASALECSNLQLGHGSCLLHGLRSSFGLKHASLLELSPLFLDLPTRARSEEKESRLLCSSHRKNVFLFWSSLVCFRSTPFQLISGSTISTPRPFSRAADGYREPNCLTISFRLATLILSNSRIT